MDGPEDTYYSDPQFWDEESQGTHEQFWATSRWYERVVEIYADAHGMTGDDVQTLLKHPP